MNRPHAVTALALALGLTAAGPAAAGGFLTGFDATGFEPGPEPGQIFLYEVPIRWDPRCIPVRYSLNTSFDPLPNPLGTPFVSLAEAADALSAAMEAWNEIPTSYIDLQLTGTTANPGLVGFDFVNELSFRAPPNFGAIAVSPSISLAQDGFIPAGADIDGDGDSDYAHGIATCADIDGDGDIEFPAGFYTADTILDNDVWFAAELGQFTVAEEDIDTNFFSVDLLGVAMHELGHSHGLAHSVITRTDPTDGNEPTMFPFFDFNDPVAQLGFRTLDPDDVGFSSLHYPEGSAASGPAALAPGDVAFDAVYGRIEGEVRHGVLEQPVAGAAVTAIDAFTGRPVAETYSGTVRAVLDTVTGQFVIADAETHILDGGYTLPVRFGLYDLAVEPLDGFPVPATSVSRPAILGSTLGQLDFGEEFWSGPLEAAVERRPGLSIPVLGFPGWVTDEIDLVTNRTVEIANFGTVDQVGVAFAPAGLYFAVRIPAQQITDAFPDGRYLLHSANFGTFDADSSVVPRFSEAMLTTGTVHPDGTAVLDLDHPLARRSDFEGQDFDFAPLYFHSPTVLGIVVERGIARGEIDDLFLVLRLPTETPFPGPSELPPLVLIDGFFGRPNDVPIFGLSYLSLDGELFFQETTVNYMFSLTLSERP